MLDGLRVLVTFLRGSPDRTALRQNGPGAGVPNRGDVAMPAERVRLSVSATDEEWEAVHGRALRRGLSRSRYLVRLVLPDASIAGPHAALLPALSGVEQREVLEAVRHMRSLLSEARHPGAGSTGTPECLSVSPDDGGPAVVGALS